MSKWNAFEFQVGVTACVIGTLAVKVGALREPFREILFGDLADPFDLSAMEGNKCGDCLKDLVL